MAKTEPHRCWRCGSKVRFAGSCLDCILERARNEENWKPRKPRNRETPLPQDEEDQTLIQIYGMSAMVQEWSGG